MTQSNEGFYQQQLQQAEIAIQKAKTKFKGWAIFRLLIFLSSGIGVYFSWGIWWLVIGIVLVGIVLFLLAVTRFQDAKTALAKSNKWRQLVAYELQVILEGTSSFFADGAEFKDANHPFSLDMDLFGAGSVFQFFNRTFSSKGKAMLADMLKSGVSDPKMVNEMVQSLSKQMAWGFQFRVNGSIDERKEALEVDLKNLSSFEIKNPVWMKLGRYVFSGIGLLALIAYFSSLISGWLFAGLLILNLLVVGKYVKSTNQCIGILTKYNGKIKFLVDQMKLIQTLETDNETLKDFIEKICKHGDGAIDSLNMLVNIQNKFEYRMNLLVGFILNGLIVWDLHQRIRLEKWMKTNRNRIGEWEENLVLLEAYLSAGTILFNHSNTVFATFQDGDSIHVQSLKHPLIKDTKAVGNDVNFNESHQLMILTGPNMAGKSTYLRSVGLMFVLANSGFPIFAKEVKIPHYKLYSSMRTSDNITTDSSYFYAELSRLKFILNEIEKGEKVFILLDEILKGTNSVDKEQGSKKFLKKLERLHTTGIIATHDLSLCELSESSNYFFNGYFDSIIDRDELHFDYIWRKGVCQNMNASFLLKKMNLIDE